MNSYYRLHTSLRTYAPRTYAAIFRHKKVAKYLCSGGMAAATNLSVLYLLTDVFHLYYLVSSVWAFVASVAVSFTLQKFWTFENDSLQRMHVQFVVYSIVVLVNLIVNTLLVYLFVEWFSIWYFAAQCFSGVIIAALSFFAYRNLVFRH